MGSFNTACFLTHQIVVPGTRCYLFPVNQDSGDEVELLDTSDGSRTIIHAPHSSTCYATGFWRYFSSPIIGTYYDYGRFNLDESELNIVAVRSLFRKLARKSYESIAGPNQYHDVPFKIDFDFETCPKDELIEKFDELWNASVHESRVFVESYSQYPRAFSFAVMLETAVDWIRQDAKTRKDWRGEKKSEQKIREELLEASHVEMHIEFMLRYMQGMRAADSSSKDFSDYRGMTISAFSNVVSMLGYSMFSFDFRDGNKLSDLIPPTLVEEIATKFVDENFTIDVRQSDIINAITSADCISDAIDRFIHASMIDRYLNFLEVRIIPSYTTGQDYENEAGDVYAKMVSSVNKTYKKILKDRYED